MKVACLVYLAVLAVLLTAHPASAQMQGQLQHTPILRIYEVFLSPDPVSQHDFSVIDLLRRANDTQGLERFAITVKSIYKNRTDKTLEYSELAYIALALANGESSSVSAAGNLSLFLLRQTDILLDTGAELLPVLSNVLTQDFDSVQKDRAKAVADRSKFTALTLELLQKYNNNILPNLGSYGLNNFLEQPSSDPAVNAARIRIREHENADAFLQSEQSILISYRNDYEPALIKLLAFAYSQRPLNTSELLRYFQKYDISPDLQTQIISAVNQAASSR